MGGQTRAQASLTRTFSVGVLIFEHRLKFNFGTGVKRGEGEREHVTVLGIRVFLLFFFVWLAWHESPLTYPPRAKKTPAKNTEIPAPPFLCVAALVASFWRMEVPLRGSVRLSVFENNTLGHSRKV